MSLSDREKIELAEVVQAVVAPMMEDLKTNIAQGFVVILECAMEDLAKVMAQRNEDFSRRWREEREARAQRRHDATKKAGF